MMTVELECGFKETEVGVIPFDWTVAALGSVADLTMGQSPPSSTYNTKGDGLPFFQGKAEFGALYPAIEKWCSQPQRVAETGSVLVSVRAPVGDVNIATSLCCIGRGLASIKARAQADNMYLFYFLMFAKSRLELEGTGTTFKSINKAVLHNFMIPLPPLPEQRRIAAVLNAIQDAIAAQEDVIAEARALKRSLMQRLFTYGPGREPAETKETEIGEIPAHWKIATIGELCDAGTGMVQTGPFGSQLHASDYVDDGIPSVMPQDIVDNRIVETNIARITVEDHQRLSRYHLRTGDIVYARRGDIGRRGLVTDAQDGWLCGTGSLFIRIGNPAICSPFLYHYLGRAEISEYIAARAVGSTMLNLNTKILRSVPVAYPDIKAQYEIAEALAAAEGKIAVEEDRKVALQDLFKSTLHQLMTGQIRLLSD